MGQDSMKILYFITTSNWGGASEHVFELCKYEEKLGNSVTFVTGSKGELLNRIETIPNVSTRVIDSVKRKISPLNDIRSVLVLRKLIKKINPDIIHLHSSKAGILGRLAAIGLDCKVIFTVHGWSFTDGISSRFRKKVFKYIEKIVAPLADLYICVSNYDKQIAYREKVLNPNKNKVVVVHNGAPLNKDCASFSTNNISKITKFIMVARFSNQKDQIGLIKACGLLSSEDKFRLTFVGSGPNLEKCKALVQKMGLGNSIQFLGFKRNVNTYLKKNDVFVLSTHYEGLPISIIESMSVGMPIIASNVGGNKELVFNKKNGFLVNNEKELVRALKYFIDNKKEIIRMGKKSQKIYLRDFTLSKNLNNIHRQYKTLLN